MWTQKFNAPGAGDLAITLLIVFIISFIDNYNFMCNHFYVNGAYVHDTGWYSGLLYRNGFLMREPLVITGYQPGAIYNLRTHFSPGLFLFSLPSRFLPISPIQNASIFFSFIYASLGSTVATAAFHCTAGYGRASRVASSSCVGLALVLSGPVVAAVGFPHAEYLFDTGAVLFFFFLFTGRCWLASLVFGFTVLMREDFGLHLAGFCIVLILYCAALGREPWRAQRMITWFASAGVAWSLLAIAVQKLFFPGDDTLTRIYLGSPAFGHLTQDFLRHRATDFTTNRPDLLVAAMAVGIAAAYRGRLSYLVGLVACIPWLLLNILAYREAPGTLSLYYGYPLIVGFVWPLLDECRLMTRSAVLTGKGARSVGVLVILTIGFVASAIALGLVQPAAVSTLRQMASPVAPATMTRVEMLAAWIAGGALKDHHLVADIGIAALAPNSVAPSQQFDKHKENGARINGIVFFLHSFNGLDALRFAIANRFNYFVHIRNTNVYVAVSRLSSPLKTVLDAFGAEEEAPFIRLLQVGPAGLAIEAGKAIQSSEPGLAAFGPYLTLPNGPYRATYSFQFRDPFCHSPLQDTQLDVGIFVHDVMAEPTRSRVEDLAPQPAREGCRLNHTRDFDISSPSGSAVLELPVWHRSTDSASIVDLRIELRNAR
jgi:hypothetical protein